MTYLTLVLISVPIFFSIILLLRSFFSFQICALCSATAVTWLALLVMHYYEYTSDPILIGMLLGGSVVGSMYLLEEKVPEQYHVFRLPFLLSFISFGYWLLDGIVPWLSILILLIIWLIASVLFIWRNTILLKPFVQEIINCCKNW